jgi:hypothetical protein
VSVPVVLVHGTADRIVDPKNSMQIAVALNARVAPSTLPEVLEIRDGQHIDAMRRPEIRSVVLERMNAWVRAANTPPPPVFVPQTPDPPDPGRIERMSPAAPGPKPAPPST